jgi:hypothetical protein
MHGVWNSKAPMVGTSSYYKHERECTLAALVIALT